MANRLEEAIAEAFAAENRVAAREILDQYGTRPHERESERVKLAALRLCEGDLAELSRMIGYARRDYRDVLYWESLSQGQPDPIADRIETATLTPAQTPRRLDVLCEAVPTPGRVAVLANPSNASHQEQVAALEARARELGIELGAGRGGPPGRLRRRVRRDGVDGLLVLSSTLHRLQARRLATLALAHRLASVAEPHLFARSGGLLGLGQADAALTERTVAHIRGSLMREAPEAGPANEPRLELLVNLRTAAALGLAIPGSILERASAVIR